jgi:hypothetical protein
VQIHGVAVRTLLHSRRQPLQTLEQAIIAHAVAGQQGLFTAVVSLMLGPGEEIHVMGIPLGEWSGSNAIRELHETIKQFNIETSRQTRQLVVLTYIIAVLTFVMTVVVTWQIWLTLRP